MMKNLSLSKALATKQQGSRSKKRRNIQHKRKGYKHTVDRTIAHFLDIRSNFKDYPGTKPPSTSEILDFLTALQDRPIDEAIAVLENLAKPDRAHWLGIVLKTEKDQALYRQIQGETT